MNAMAQCLISKDNGKLQIPYKEYAQLMEKLEEAKRVVQVKNEVLALLQKQLTGAGPAKVQPVAGPKVEVKQPETKKPEPVAEPQVQAEKVSIEFEPDTPKPAQPEPKVQQETAARTASTVDIPPIKKEIAEHFNSYDASGRLFNVFKQFYTCLNEACGGTVRVTMKDGVCSLWNYDEWEEFAFVDIYENELRFAVDPRYTDELASLNICEGSRLLASRRNLVSILVCNLNKTMLSVLTKAFREVGLPTS